MRIPFVRRYLASYIPSKVLIIKSAKITGYEVRGGKKLQGPVTFFGSSEPRKSPHISYESTYERNEGTRYVHSLSSKLQQQINQQIDKSARRMKICHQDSVAITYFFRCNFIVGGSCCRSRDRTPSSGIWEYERQCPMSPP